MHRLVYLLAAVTISYAQGPDKQARSYHLFFHNTAILDAKLAELERQSPGRGQPMVRAVASTIGLTTAETARFFALATRIDKQLTALDPQAAAIISTAKKQKTAEGLIAPAPASLKELEDRRQKIVRDGIAHIAGEVGSTAAAKIEQHLQNLPLAPLPSLRNPRQTGVGIETPTPAGLHPPSRMSQRVHPAKPTPR